MAKKCKICNGQDDLEHRKRERGRKRKRYVPSTHTFTFTFTNLLNIMLTITE